MNRIFTHIMTPRPPFFFDADGGLISEAEYKLPAHRDREKYLDQDYELLEDRSYYSPYWLPYDFYDVTEIRDYI